MRLALLVWLLLCTVLPAVAHESAPLYITFEEYRAHHYRIEWRSAVPAYRDGGLVGVEPACEDSASTDKLTQSLSTSLINVRYVYCSGGINGKTVHIRAPEQAPSLGKILIVEHLDGERTIKALGKGEHTWSVPPQRTASRMAYEYATLGIGHILRGIDHLLFLLCLTLIAGNLRRLLLVVSGFTLAHAVTLALITFDLLRVPAAATEAVIALSIVFLALEVARGQRDTLTWRHPVVVSSLFGLLHGAGFAAALNDLGLARDDITVGLIFFNIGVEMGQIGFVLMVVPTLIILTQLTKQSAGDGLRGAPQVESNQVNAVDFWRAGVPVPLWVAYGSGTLATYWLLERFSTFAIY